MTDPVVVCLGVATIDVIALVDSIPGHDERTQAHEVVSAGGGPAATAAVALARLGIPVAFCGVVGDDDAGVEVRRGLEAEGVDTKWLRTDRAARTVQSLILVERGSGARTIVTSGSALPEPADIPDVGEWLHADQAGWPAARLAARGSHRRLSLDDGNRVPNLHLPMVDLYVPTASVITERFGQPLATAMAAAHGAGASAVVATAGSSGCYVLEGAGLIHLPAAQAEVVSTLGAGDVFHGALLAGLINGASTVEAAAFAVLVAALSTGALDGRSAIPRAGDVPAPGPRTTTNERKPQHDRA